MEAAWTSRPARDALHSQPTIRAYDASHGSFSRASCSDSKTACVGSRPAGRRRRHHWRKTFISVAQGARRHWVWTSRRIVTDVEATPRGVSEVVSTLWKEQPETFKALRQVGHTRHRDDALRPASNVRLRPGPSH